jgi:hypothetical protein
MKCILIALAIAISATAAFAEGETPIEPLTPPPPTLCGNLFKMFGEFYDAAMICHWDADDPAIEKAVKVMEDGHCDKETDATMSRYTKQGGLEFQYELTKLGEKEACRGMRHFMNSFNHPAK